MKLVTFTQGGTTRAGAVVGNEVVDAGFGDMTALLAGGLDRVREAVTRSAVRLPLTKVRLEAPVPRPPKFLAVGLNYADHVAESGAERPALPTIFNKQSTCVTGPYDPVHRPRVSPMLDYEGELGFVIGRRCRHVPRDRAAEVIAGWVVVNDVTVATGSSACPPGRWASPSTRTGRWGRGS
jgi:2-keto-4-pentenoate hydratase/2-oxohepta-3-ene-1,7-dioic acid hydratase in catechol pathway